ncbi:MAG TPA: PEP/pyruvate-binding domain-containing protein, partial [Anaerolineales bacterium]|nr:PEP/pyruvate-binding domain-containing protein [Anaerolineales bacterium]
MRITRYAPALLLINVTPYVELREPSPIRGKVAGSACNFSQAPIHLLCNNIPMIILPFSSLDATLATAGGKGLNLARLIRAGFAVPHGFIISTNAYREFVNANR